ncbi:hypothetical protein K432DRAFT_332336 [Lepidopterella palustris CBS 459.81]|uniref:Aminoglycoside phosphotransferase domain-containing protein n=1 Tax=Lepidopterella palustris CBS 459.81 TaxID=1314670 RepID=A0A8E2E6J1_9PEZI|nr:hypothetical protein K432DRAFT_332336 [Lepidopterella palustris CBS 459.81]
MPKASITTTPELEAYLTQNAKIPFSRVVSLSGGTANFTWRLYSPSGESSIIKHAESYVKDITTMPFSTDRMDFEKKAMDALPMLIPQDDLLRIPKIHFYDPNNHVLQLTDGGPRTLKEAYTDHLLNIPVLGRRIGIWLARLHASTRSVDLKASFDNQTAKSIYRYAYASSPAVFSVYGHDAAVGSRINETYGSQLRTDSVCICHGDFWPGNLIVQSAVSYGWSNFNTTVVDWEMVRDGCGATDVAQFAAEAWLLDRFRGGRGLFGAFLKGYAEGARENGEVIGDGFLERVAAHFGTHVAFWPTVVEWGTKEETKELVSFGYDLLVKVLEMDLPFMKNIFSGLETS